LRKRHDEKLKTGKYEDHYDLYTRYGRERGAVSTSLQRNDVQSRENKPNIIFFPPDIREVYPVKSKNRYVHINLALLFSTANEAAAAAAAAPELRLLNLATMRLNTGHPLVHAPRIA
jgi:hypothetical protein